MKTLEITYSNIYGYTAVKGYSFNDYLEINAVHTDLTETELIDLINANPDCIVIGF